MCPNFFLSAYGHHLLKNNFIDTKTSRIARYITTDSKSIDILVSNQIYNENFRLNRFFFSKIITNKKKCHKKWPNSAVKIFYQKYCSFLSKKGGFWILNRNKSVGIDRNRPICISKVPACSKVSPKIVFCSKLKNSWNYPKKITLPKNTHFFWGGVKLWNVFWPHDRKEEP